MREATICCTAIAVAFVLFVACCLASAQFRPVTTTPACQCCPCEPCDCDGCDCCKCKGGCKCPR